MSARLEAIDAMTEAMVACAASIDDWDCTDLAAVGIDALIAAGYRVVKLDDVGLSPFTYPVFAVVAEVPAGAVEETNE